MSPNIYDIVGERIREERKKAGLTIEKLAELAQISFLPGRTRRAVLAGKFSGLYWPLDGHPPKAGTYASIETKGRKASLETIQKLAQALRIPVARLFGRLWHTVLDTAPAQALKPCRVPTKIPFTRPPGNLPKLIRDKNANETSGIPEVAKAAASAKQPGG
ncbi:MAG: helix-turn-helix domain-containing protein [Elusimicrobia bacterium]|nr:helix-turn-helix domain-containing protein [Elusimicrobiota bacterium]